MGYWIKGKASGSVSVTGTFTASMEASPDGRTAEELVDNVHDWVGEAIGGDLLTFVVVEDIRNLEVTITSTQYVEEDEDEDEDDEDDDFDHEVEVDTVDFTAVFRATVGEIDFELQEFEEKITCLEDGLVHRLGERRGAWLQELLRQEGIDCDSIEGFDGVAEVTGVGEDGDEFTQEIRFFGGGGRNALL